MIFRTARTLARSVFTSAFAATLCCITVILPAVAAPHPGDLAPPFSLPRASGSGTVSLAAFKGKPIYLNFFASWCAPCNAEAGSVATLYRKYHSRGLAVVGIDEDEEKGKALDFARKHGWPFAIAVDSGDLNRNYGVYGLPVHIFIDKRGKFSTYRLGEMEPNEIEDAIRKIL